MFGDAKEAMPLLSSWFASAVGFKWGGARKSGPGVD